MQASNSTANHSQLINQKPPAHELSSSPPPLQQNNIYQLSQINQRKLISKIKRQQDLIKLAGTYTTGQPTQEHTKSNSRNVSSITQQVMGLINEKATSGRNKVGVGVPRTGSRGIIQGIQTNRRQQQLPSLRMVPETSKIEENYITTKNTSSVLNQSPPSYNSRNMPQRKPHPVTVASKNASALHRSFNFDLLKPIPQSQNNIPQTTTSHQQLQIIPHHLQEHPSKDGKLTFALACGPLLRPRYINPKLEKELVDFKIEVEQKHAKAGTRTYKFPRQIDQIHAELSTSPQSGKKIRLIGNQQNSEQNDKGTFSIREFLKQEHISQLLNYNGMKKQAISQNRYQNNTNNNLEAINNSYQMSPEVNRQVKQQQRTSQMGMNTVSSRQMINQSIVGGNNTQGSVDSSANNESINASVVSIVQNNLKPQGRYRLQKIANSKPVPINGKEKYPQVRSKERAPHETSRFRDYGTSGFQSQLINSQSPSQRQYNIDQDTARVLSSMKQRLDQQSNRNFKKQDHLKTTRNADQFKNFQLPQGQNLINMTNPQVINQNNTIILVDSSQNNPSMLWQSLEKTGIFPPQAFQRQPSKNIPYKRTTNAQQQDLTQRMHRNLEEDQQIFDDYTRQIVGQQRQTAAANMLIKNASRNVINSIRTKYQSSQNNNNDIRNLISKSLNFQGQNAIAGGRTSGIKFI